MRAPNANELLSVWERGVNRNLLERALLLLDVACSDGVPADTAQLSIGDRDARLLQLREWMFGSRLLNMCHCPQCNECIEWISQTSDLRVAAVTDHIQEPLELDADPYRIRFRLPNSYDLAAAVQRNDTSPTPRQLISGCILELQKGDHSCAPEELPDEVFNKIDQQMALANGQANINMALHCPGCSWNWELPFDIVSYLWSEIHNWARHTLQDIAALAATFGWSESTILGLSPQRRQIYLDIIKK